MSHYSPYHLQKIQQRRAVYERPIATKYDTLIDSCAVSIPLPATELLTAHLTPETTFELPSVNLSQRVQQTIDTAILDTDIPTPFPLTNELTDNPDAFSTNPKLGLGVLTELAPLLTNTLSIQYPNERAVLLAVYTLQQMDKDHMHAAQARLSRIHTTNTPEPYTTVTDTEASIYMSELSLRTPQAVNPTGVGIMYQCLVGRLEEMGVNPDDVLPTGTLKQSLPTERDPTPNDERDEQTIETLMGEKHDETEALRINLKFMRDCMYLRDLHDLVIETLPYSDVSCAELTWKDAAVAVQENTDPFAGEPDTTESPVIDTDAFPTTPETVGESATEQNIESDTNQTGLGQF